MKYRARIIFRSKQDLHLSQEENKALDQAESKFKEVGAISIVDGIQYVTEFKEDLLGFCEAAAIIIQELDSKIAEQDYSQIKIEIHDLK